MINFFRRIRQKLIDKGNLKRYLLYAMGEILLVMIGILLALQVSNWNQNKSEELISKDYTNNLRTELESDLNYFIKLQAQNDSQIKKLDKLVIGINSYNLTYDTETELIIMLMDAMRTYPFSPKNATYIDLITSGKMGLIKPTSLRQKLISHYNLQEQKSEHFNRQIDYNWNHITSFFNNNGYFEWRNNPLTSIESNLIKKADKLSILMLNKSSLEFKAIENNIYFEKAILIVRNQYLDELIQSSEDLINDIKNRQDELKHCN